jgi:predicted nucleic acid binding AN1-type Zn finger protein
MSWIISKIMKPRKSVGLRIFSTPTIQLGDIVNIEYKDSERVDQILPSTSRFVVYNIEYTKNSEGPEMTLHLSEVN